MTEGSKIDGPAPRTYSSTITVNRNWLISGSPASRAATKHRAGSSPAQSTTRRQSREVVATVGNTVYVVGGANRPAHEGPIATIEALDFI